MSYQLQGMYTVLLLDYDWKEITGINLVQNTMRENTPSAKTNEELRIFSEKF